MPKWLLDVEGTTIAERQLDAVDIVRSESPGAIASIRVVTGHAAAAIDDYLALRYPGRVSSLYNDRYADLNNWF